MPCLVVYIATEHKDFWKDVTVEHLMQVYLASNATTYNVLKVIKKTYGTGTTARNCLWIFFFNMLVTSIMLKCETF